MARPRTEPRPDGSVTINGNGTGICCGGWQFVCTNVTPGAAYHIQTEARHEGITHAGDSLVAMVLWDEWPHDSDETRKTPWNYLLPQAADANTTRFVATLRAPAGARTMTIRFSLRWSRDGRSTWSSPKIVPVVLPMRQTVKACVVTATRQTQDRIRIEPFGQGAGLPEDVAKSVDLWASLVLEACRRNPDLIVTPEVVIGGKDIWEGAIDVPGPATRPFQKMAQEHHVHVVLGVRERTKDTLYNSAVLLGPDGGIAGVYRKVHLATSEGLSGVSPGDGFPVFKTAIGRIGCMICMDTTVCESARMLALNGADFICFPIMGDLRADRFSPGPPIFNEDRWKSIMRTRALDNQVCLIIARNGAQGSCIIDRKGEFLAWNEGDREFIEAHVPLEDASRIWDGGDFREVTFMLRRPHLYAPFTDPGGLKPLQPEAAPQTRP